MGWAFEKTRDAIYVFGAFVGVTAPHPSFKQTTVLSTEVRLMSYPLFVCGLT